MEKEEAFSIQIRIHVCIKELKSVFLCEKIVRSQVALMPTDRSFKLTAILVNSGMKMVPLTRTSMLFP